MREKGCSEEEILSLLSIRKEKDTPYSRILSSMCTLPHPIAVKAHQMFISTNLGDPGLFCGTAELERMLIERLGTLLGEPGAGGYATSGGTESNIQALRIASKLKNSKRPNVVMPDSAHFSFEKACDMLGLEVRSVPLDRELRMDADRAADLIDDDTVCMVAIAGTTEYGMVDPIGELSRIAAERDIFLHVDAAFGGLVLPFLENAPKFDFSLAGVSSISLDPHKMGMSTIPSGCLLVREPEVLELLNIQTPYLTVRQGYTLSGTRSGAPVAAALAVLDHLGCEGMRAMVRGCMKNTRRLIEGMETFGFPSPVQPDTNVATFQCKNAPTGWKVSWTRQGHMRIVCMPHVDRSVIEAFLKDVSGKGPGE
ncbi:MAG: tyrosine decarboxylase MfnA [Methanomicrobiales archaeon]|nr:tyrosine decarboxylase MfnA [Methanomicrobiales archaeon]